MKNILKHIMVATAVMLLHGCSGNTDTEVAVLKLRADKTSVAADGKDMVTFTVTYGTDDISLSQDMNLTVEIDGSRTRLDAGTNTFSTRKSGEYMFTAEYKDGNRTIYSEDKVVVSATEVSTQVSYYHKMLAMMFTSVHCTYCPLLAEAITAVKMVNSKRIAPVAFHSDKMGQDPMTLPLNDRIYEKVSTGDGLPMFAFDFRKSSQHIVNEYAKIISELNSLILSHISECGVAIESVFDETSRELKVTAKFKTSRAKAYRYHIFLVEDGIEYMQAGHEGSSPYIHNNVLRAASADNVFGSKLNLGNALTPGTEYAAQKTFELPEEWNHNNMRVIVSILGTSDGSSYSCDNTNECPLGQNADYLYEE